MRNIEDKFRTRVESLVGLMCSATAGTSGVGSMITLLFGALSNEEVSLPSFGKFTNVSSDTWLSLECAAWRLEKGGEWLCSSTSDTGVGSPMERGVSNMKGQHVTKVELSQMMDLSLHFPGGLVFKIFCDQASEDNYALKYGQETFIVGPQGQISSEISP